MKKICIIVFLLLASVAVKSQDTVNESMPWYMFLPHERIVYAGFYPHDNASILIGNTMRQYYGKDSCRINVYGMAATLRYIPAEEDRRIRAIRMTPTAMLLDHEAYGNPPTVSFVDSANVLGLFKECRFEYQVANGESVISPCYEYYFNTPHEFNLPNDTFYVSLYWPSERSLNWLYWWLFDQDSNRDYWIQDVAALTTDTSWTPRCWGTSGGMFDFNYTSMGPGSRGYWGVFFPIINLRCMAPRAVLKERGNGTATIGWRQEEEGECYQLSLGPYGSNPDSGMIVAPTDTVYTFHGLAIDSIYYSVWARKACRYTTAGYDTLVWSEWGRPVIFRPMVGIGEVDDYMLQVIARDGCIAVRGLTAGQRAEIYDIKGCRVASLSADGLTPPLPQGVYMVRTGHCRARKVVLLR